MILIVAKVTTIFLKIAERGWVTKPNENIYPIGKYDIDYQVAILY